MPCYLIAHVDVTYRTRYSEYAAAAVQLMEAVHGRVLAVGSAESLEGEPMPNHNVIMEFPDEQSMRTWYESDAYRALIPVRHEASSFSQIGLLKGWRPRG